MECIQPALMALIDVLAEAKMHCLLAMHTKEGSEERAAEMKALEEGTRRSRERVDELGGIGKLPRQMAVDLRVCELGLERLGGPKAPPHKE